MGKLWNIIEDWRDGMAPFKPSWRQIAIRMGVSQSTFETWKAPTEMPKRRNLWSISQVTGVPYRRVVDAAIEDTRLYEQSAAETAWEDWAAKNADKIAMIEGDDVVELDAEGSPVTPHRTPKSEP